jgi:hypothetical protein
VKAVEKSGGTVTKIKIERERSLTQTCDNGLSESSQWEGPDQNGIIKVIIISKIKI